MTEKRLIDATALLAQFPVGGGVTAARARRAIERAETVDAVEVVRCGECRWSSELPEERKNDYFAPECVRVCTVARADFDACGICTVHVAGFCDEGERKEEHNGKAD